MADSVQNKALLIAELNKKSDEFVEAWKQSMRNTRATIHGNRQRLLTDVVAKSAVLKKASSSKPLSVEAAKQRCLEQLRAKRSTTIVEQWKAEAIEAKRLLIATHHQLMADVNAKRQLRRRSTSFLEQRNAVLAALKKEPMPEWKERQMKAKSDVYANRNQCMQAISGARATLKCKDDLVVKRARVMEEIRKEAPVESWKQETRDLISKPIVSKQMLLNDLVLSKPSLKSTKNARTELFNSIKAINGEATPEWKEKAQNQRRAIIEAKHELTLEIPSAKLTPTVNHVELMAAIRAASAVNAEQTVAVEGWKQSARNQKAAAMQAKKSVLVSLTSDKPQLKSTSKNNHANLLNAIRSEPLEAWKEQLYRFRRQAIQAKRAVLCDLVEKKSALKNNTGVADNKIALLAELRATSGNELEAWKETERNTRAKQLSNQRSMFAELANKKQLKSTKSTEQTKLAIMKELRAKTTAAIPQWQEEERECRATAQNMFHKMICELNTTAKTELIENVQSMDQIKKQVLSDIRRKQPVEGWKEQEREAQATLYSNKRQVVDDIKSGKVSNSRKQVDLKEAILKEIRALGDLPVPAWKEDRMSKRLQVIKNKTMLNQEICKRIVM